AGDGGRGGHEHGAENDRSGDHREALPRDAVASKWPVPEPVASGRQRPRWPPAGALEGQHHRNACWGCRGARDGPAPQRGGAGPGGGRAGGGGGRGGRGARAPGGGAGRGLGGWWGAPAVVVKHQGDSLGRRGTRGSARRRWTRSWRGDGAGDGGGDRVPVR